MTNQGYADESTWSRGQAWPVMGFAQTYTWTKDEVYLKTAIGCAKYFLGRLEESKSRWHHPFVPTWDFDAPGEDEREPLRDVSAGVIVANGLLIIHQALQSLPSSRARELSLGIDFLDASLIIVSETLDMALDTDFSDLEVTDQGDSKLHITRESGFDAILRHATANNNQHAHKPYSDHGLVYADYYLIEYGNKLLRMGLI